MRRSMILAYGVLSYAVGLGSLVYMIGWLANLIVPRSIDSPGNGSLGIALLVNIALFVAYGLQHSLMARPGFKAWLKKFIPEAAERSTYVLASGIGLLAVMFLWQPMAFEVWHVTNPLGKAALYVLYAVGWANLVGSTFVINHFDLFGLRQVWLEFRGREYTHLDFATPGPYRIVRHPLYVGWITLAWATPTMTIAHLIYAVISTTYILVAIRYEERDLIAFHGAAYADYRSRTPMLVPGLGSSSPIQTPMNEPHAA